MSCHLLQVPTKIEPTSSKGHKLCWKARITNWMSVGEEGLVKITFGLMVWDEIK